MTVELRARPHHSPRRTPARGLLFIFLGDSGRRRNASTAIWR